MFAWGLILYFTAVITEYLINYVINYENYTGWSWIVDRSFRFVYFSLDHLNLNNKIPIQ